MADRKVVVSLVAEVNNYVAGMEKASRTTKELGSEAEKLAQKKQALADIGAGFLAIGAVAAVGVTLAVKSFADFDQKLSNIKAATNESAGNMGLLREAAIQAGKDTAFSAGEAADAVTELAKAGVATADILSGGLTGALDLAAAGEISVARAAEIAATALTQFKLEGADVGKVADLLSSGANKAQGGVEELSGALSQGGLVAAATGLTIEETVGTLSAFASAGLLGSDAGTSFKSMLQRLTPQSKEAKDRMDELGISAYDAQGAFIGMEAFAGNLQAGLKDLTPEARNAAQAVIFGTDAVRASNILYEQGAEGIGKWIDEVDDSGAAARTAATKLDNLNGDLQILSGSFQTALIETGSGANGVLRELVQNTTFLVNAFGSLPGPALGVALALGGVVAAVGLVGGTALIAVPKVAAFKLALDGAGISGKRAAIGIGVASGALAGAAFVFGNVSGRLAEIDSATTEIAGSLDKATGALTDYSRELVSKKLAESGAYDAALEAGVSQRELTDAVLEGGDALDAVKKKLSGNNTIGTFFTGVGIRAGNASGEIRDLGKAVEDSRTQWENQKKAVDPAAQSMEEAAVAAEAAQEAENGLFEAISAANGEFVTYGDAIGKAQEKNQAFAQSTADSTESADDSWETYYDGFSFSLANYLVELEAMVTAQDEWETNMILLSSKVSAGVLDELAKMGPEGAPLVAALVDGSAEEIARMEELFGQGATDATGAFAAELSDAQAVVGVVAAKFGQNTADEVARELAEGTTTVQEIMEKYRIAVEGVTPTVDVNTGPALSKLAILNNVLRGLPANTVAAGTGTVLLPEGRASGGAIYGPGSGTSDTAGLYALSNGEHVLTAAEVAAMGGQSSVYDFRRGLRGQAYMSAPSGGRSGGGSSSSRTINASYNISGEGTSPGEVLRLIEARESQRMRSLV